MKLTGLPKYKEEDTVNQMKTKRRKFVEIFYDPEKSNWDAVTEKELKRHGLRQGQVTVICKPKNPGQK